jgi:hypothetical protein
VFVLIATGLTGCQAGGPGSNGALTPRTARAALPTPTPRVAPASVRPAVLEAVEEIPVEPLSPLVAERALGRQDNEAAALPELTRCPAEMALVGDDVCVDRWEGSLLERLPDGTERAWSPFTPVDACASPLRAVSKSGTIPQGYISGKQARATCVASGKRLCTAEEWVRGCKGPDNTVFPYGPERRARVCNDDIRRVHPVAEIAQRVGLPPEQWWREGMNNPLINQLPNSLLSTGDRAQCTNGYGVFDMVGNLHEWIDDPDGTFRGGFYMDTSRNGQGCEYATVAHDFGYHDYSTGFRCCRDADHVE